MYGTIEGTQSTSIDAIKTKACCVTKKYFTDDFIGEMDKSLPLNKVFLPLINRGTYSRCHCISSSIRGFLDNLTEEQNVNIISLGSGYDTLAFNLLNQLYSNFSYYELDYEQIVSKKNHLIKSSKKISDLLQEHSNYHLINCDISDTKQLTTIIEKIPNENFTIIICECILVYLTMDESLNIIKTLKNRFSNCALISYDLIHGDDGFGREMISNLKQRNIELKGFDTINTTQDQINRLKECGFTKVNFIDMQKYYYQCIPKEDIKRIESLEMMDELEEFFLLQNHACFGYGIEYINDKFALLKEKVMKF